ncbi:hypothetical protein N7533_012198 [Penicillium manginii]|uniref:uncharacterized protein n=1 Tax=Penicillium manginii TaxID=203109 RepID=UPI0025498C91|nr:uncharacterized protein N7533_012198 [Penicillium manginii]KAJ5739414.1 hypothetical protein N7533_012198 [Penicillium manginii]
MNQIRHIRNPLLEPNLLIALQPLMLKNLPQTRQTLVEEDKSVMALAEVVLFKGETAGQSVDFFFQGFFSGWGLGLFWL